MSAKIGLKKWLRRVSLALVIFAVLSVTPYFAVRAFVELVRAFDDRSASPQEALSSLTIYPHGGFTTLIPEGVDYEILQRQVLRYASPSGILYGLGWQDEDGESCFATAFVERMTDSFGGWTGRGAFGHCNTLDYTGWVSGAGEYRGFSVANGLSGDAALVKVTWLNNEVTFAQPINGAYMSVLDRHAARASRVEFFNAAGDRIEEHQALRLISTPRRQPFIGGTFLRFVIIQLNMKWPREADDGANRHHD